MSEKPHSIADRTNYVLITPARNEAAFIERTINAVCSQTIPPLRWIVVNDNSTDHTAEIVASYTQRFPFIRLISVSGESQRNFGAKVRAFARGLEALEGLDYQFIGNLDADISFEADYYERILERFAADLRLGIAGGIRYDWCNGSFHKVICAPDSVGGPFQFFRKQCFEDVGGFKPVKIGGVDAIAEISAKMHGWKVRSFPVLKVYHYRCTGTATGSMMMARFRDGMKDFVLGYDPLFEAARCLYRFKENGYSAGGLFRISGYFWAFLKNYQRPVSKEFVQFLRADQRRRLREMLPGFRKALRKPS